MRAVPILLATLMAMSGCTATRLKNSTLSQAGTLTELQYQQVLNNLALFSANPFVLPSLVNLKDGSAQIADLGSASYLGDWHRAFASHPGLQRARTVVEQWGMSPVTNDTELRLIRLAFQRSAGIDRSLETDRDLANDLAHEIVKELPDIDDYRGTVVREFEDYRNMKRKKYARRPTSIADADAILDFLYMTVPKNAPDEESPSLYINFMSATLSSMDSKIILDSELVSFLNTYLYYDEIVFLGGKKYYINLHENNDNNFATPAAFAHRGRNTDGGVVLDDGTKVLYVTPEAAEARRQVKGIEKDLLSLRTDRCWYGRGRKHDVPPDACYVGHAGDCYVWVGRDGLEELSNLTLKVLSFSGLIKDSQVLTVPGPRFTPASGFSGP